MTGDEIDVFMEPLIDKILLHWTEGVIMCDVGRFKGDKYFVMQTIIIFTMNDFPSFGMVAGTMTKGYKGCPNCGPETESRRSKALRKNVYEH